MNNIVVASITKVKESVTQADAEEAAKLAKLENETSNSDEEESSEIE